MKRPDRGRAPAPRAASVRRHRRWAIRGALVGAATTFASCGELSPETEAARGVISGLNLVVAVTIAVIVVAVGFILVAVAADRFVRSRQELATAEREDEAPMEEEEAEIAGIAQGSAGVPRWLYAAYVIIPIWAIAFIFTNVQVASEAPPPPQETEAPDGGQEGQDTTFEIAARNIAFDVEEIEVVADTEVTIVFENLDAGIPHNVAVYQTDAATEDIFVGDLFNGVATEEYVFTSPPPGEYYFRCDVHPSMDGIFRTVVATARAADEGGDTSTEITAQNIRFDEDTLELSAGATVEIEFHNEDAGIPHNVAIYTDENATEEIFVGSTFNGVATETYSFEAPDPGSYYFRCDVHPSMEGTIAFT